NHFYPSLIIHHYKTPTNKPTLHNPSITLHINNPTSPHPIHLTFHIQHPFIKHPKFHPQPSSISISTPSIMTQPLKPHTFPHPIKITQQFSKIILRQEYQITQDIPHIQPLQGLAQFPPR
ncbi:iron-sulfur cluster assembly scaffold protein, partial [Staphylococcus saprophyticus]|uniref:iron-sulfur cluster assembly scaffold protein n=1 Tax=Staphylococcus saprophyticus TaxID=29385 RepID=UPI001243D7AA